MPFDWFIVAAISINFIVVLWLLKRFLYKSKIKDLDAREQHLQNLMSLANSEMDKAKKLQNSCEQKYQLFEQQQASILKETQDKAAEVGKNLEASAHKAAEDMLHKRLGAIQHELQTIRQKVLKQNIVEVYAIAAKILTDLIGVDLQEAMVSRFLERFKTLPHQQCLGLMSALKRSDNLVIIRSATALSDQDKLKISQSISSLLSNKLPINFKFNYIVVPDLVAGLELSVSGWKLTWSVNQHLQSLQQDVMTALQLTPFHSTTKPKQYIAASTATEHSDSLKS